MQYAYIVIYVQKLVDSRMGRTASHAVTKIQQNNNTTTTMTGCYWTEGLFKSSSVENVVPLPGRIEAATVSTGPRFYHRLHTLS